MRRLRQPVLPPKDLPTPAASGICFISPVGNKGNLSLLEIIVFFSRGLNQMEARSRAIPHNSPEVGLFWTVFRDTKKKPITS